MQRYPIAYLRRSSADANDPGDVSREAQETAVRALAHKDGHNGDLRTFTDWGKSASEEKSASRTEYAKMVARIEAGEVSDVYAYSLDRLNRSLILSARFAKACEAKDVRIVTEREGEVRQDTPDQWLRWTILATFGEYELKVIKSRVASSMRVRRENGGHIGRVGYGYQLARNDHGAIVAVPDPDHPLEPIIDAVRDGGSILGGCKLLRLRGIPAPDGGKVWGSTTLRRIIERAAPELIPPVGPTGRHQPTHAILAQLLACHCGHILTPEGRRGAYRCTRGNRLGRDVHGPVWVSEKALLPWVRAEVGHLRIIDPATGEPIDAVRLAADHAARRATLAGRLERANELYIAGRITGERYAAEADAVTAELDRLGDAEAVVGVPPIDWTWEPRSVNAVLRAILKRVELGPDLRPIRAEWSVPAWRA